MVKPDRPPRNAFVKGARKIYNPIGFSKGYNFVLWFILCGALFGFSVARLPMIDFHGLFCNLEKDTSFAAGPGECFYYLQGYYTVGMILHLATILPASVLACFQFVPAIRHRFIILHRVNGYIVLLLTLLGMAGVFMITNVSYGGSAEIVVAVVLLGALFLVALVMAFINIKRLQIEQHRAWMIRAWVYVCGSTLVVFFGVREVARPTNFTCIGWRSHYNPPHPDQRGLYRVWFRDLLRAHAL